METLLQDLRFGFRTLVHRPAFTIVAALTLALGIGANTAIFSVVNGVLLRSLPYQNPDRIVMLWETSSASKTIHASHLNLVDWREQNRTLELMSGYTGRWGGQSTITGGREPERAYAVSVYRDFFNVFGVQPVVGRTFLREESQLGSNPVAVISYGFWKRQFGGEAIDNKKLTVDGLTCTVVGVMPSGFNIPADTDIWLSREQLYRDSSSRSSHNFVVVGRLKPGVTIEQAQTDLTSIGEHLAQQYPENNGRGVNVVGMKDQLVGSVRPALLILLVSVGILLLIACANVANLQLAKALSRQKEIAVRTALGATRMRIVRQLLTESVLLSALGGAIGLLLAYWLVTVLVAMAPASIPRIDEIGIDGRTLVFTLGVSLVTSLLFGLVPALRVSSPNLQESLKDGGRTSSGTTGGLRSILVVAEVALTLVLLVGAGLLGKSFMKVMEVDPGFKPDQVLTMQIALPSSKYREEFQMIGFYRQLFNRLDAVPGIQSAGMVNDLPMSGVNINGQFLIEGQNEKPGYSNFRVVSPGYFKAMGIPVIKGRTFNEQDAENSTMVCVISQSVAKASWPNEDPIGKRIKSGMDNRYESWNTIIGVVGDVRHAGLEGSNAADLYVDYTQHPSRADDMVVVAKSNGEPTAMVSALRAQVRELDQELPVTFQQMTQVFSNSVANRRYNALLLGSFATVALIMAVMGLYGVMSYAVSQGTREIGIRMALGAQSGQVLKLIVTQGLLMTLVGIGLGVIGAIGLTRLMATMLFGVTTTDLPTFLAVSGLLTLVAIVACYIPARRATRIDPMVALRSE